MSDKPNNAPSVDDIPGAISPEEFAAQPSARPRLAGAGQAPGRPRSMPEASRPARDGGPRIDVPQSKEQMGRLRERAGANFDFGAMSGREVLDQLKSRLEAQGEGGGGQRLMLLKAISRISEEYARLESEVDLLFEGLTDAEEKLRLFMDKD